MIVAMIVVFCICFVFFVIALIGLQVRTTGKIKKEVPGWASLYKFIKECPKCKQEMDYEDGIHRWNVRNWYCECGHEEDEDITGDLIDHAKDTMEER